MLETDHRWAFQHRTELKFIDGVSELQLKEKELTTSPDNSNRYRRLNNFLRRQHLAVARVAIGMAKTGATDQLGELLAIAPRQTDRALICLGAAHSFLAAANPRNEDPLPRDACEMLVRCNLPVPLPQTRCAAR